MIWQWIGLAGLMFAGLGLITYRLGKRRGMTLGRVHAEAELPILLRRQVLKSGHCPVCDTSHANMVQCPKRGD